MQRDNWIMYLALRLAALLTLTAVFLAFGFGVGFTTIESAPAGSVHEQSAGQNGILAVVGANEATLHEAPAGDIVRSLPAGTVLTALGKTADDVWVVVFTNDGVAGWTEVDKVVIFGLEQLPVMIEGETGSSTADEVQAPVLLPTPTNTKVPTPTATASPSPTPSPTPLPTPTATPTPTSPPTPTAVSTIANSATPGSSQLLESPQVLSGGTRGQTALVAVVGNGGADLVVRPGGDVVQALPAGTAVTALARTGDIDPWLLVTTSSGSAGWLEAGEVVVFNQTALPVIAADVLERSEVDEEAATPAGETVVETVSPDTGVSPVPAVTSQPLPVLSPTPVRRPTPIAVEGQMTAAVDIDDSRLNVRRGPGTDYVIVDKILPGEVFVVTGRSGDSAWVRIESADMPRGYGWVSSLFVKLSDSVTDLPVMDQSEDSSEAGVPSGSDDVQPLVQSEELTGRLVFQSAPGAAIYVHDLASGASREVSSGFDPAISADGTTIAFTRGGGDNGLFLAGVDGSDERKIFSGSELLRAPSWSPDGKWIVFSRASGEYECRDVGFGICLPDNPFLEEFPLSKRPELSLSRVNTDGNDFADLPALTSGQAPDWNEAGIVYQSNSGLEITSNEPGDTTRMLVSAPYYQDPSWQPGGDRIVFQSREGNHWEIFSVNSDGSGLTALTRPATTLVDELPSNVAPSWSPDGRKIVFLSNRDDENDSGSWRIWVMDADGSGARPISLDVPIDYTFASEQVVSWGP